MSRKWAPIGHRPIAPVKIGYENTYLYLTICPFTGEGFGAFLPRLNSKCFAWFVAKIQQELTEKGLSQKALFIADGATAHKEELFDKQRIVFEKLPAACPELNPVERLFKEIRKSLKNKVFDTLEFAQKRIQNVVKELCHEEGKITSITCFPYLKNTT